MHRADQDNSTDSDIETLDGDNDNNHPHIPAFVGQDNPTAKEMRDNIAQAMWEDYQNVLADCARDELDSDNMDNIFANPDTYVSLTRITCNSYDTIDTDEMHFIVCIVRCSYKKFTYMTTVTTHMDQLQG